MCGIQYPLQNGNTAECDPEKQRPCCSSWGQCGITADHCTCEGCVDYRNVEPQGGKRKFDVDF